jgi:hypothetical protein
MDIVEQLIFDVGISPVLNVVIILNFHIIRFIFSIIVIKDKGFSIDVVSSISVVSILIW